MPALKFIKWFSEIDKDDIALVGGKGANLGEMVSFGIPVPPGFVVTAKAYFYFLEENNLKPQIQKILLRVDKNDPYSYSVASEKIKKLILKGIIPKDLAFEIMKSYLELGGKLKNVLVAVRSSATAEDLPSASFAGQQASFLNIQGEANVVLKVRECWASLFEPRAIFYREEKGFDHFKVGIAVPIQKMVQSHASGVMFTIDPITQQKNRILIEAIYGLGELVVQGTVIPDRYTVDKNSLKILEKQVSNQPLQLIKVGTLNKQSLLLRNKQSLLLRNKQSLLFHNKQSLLLRNKQTKVPKNLQDKQKITNRQIIELARLGKKIHQHYFFPQDIEWAVEKGKIYILQTRPVTTLAEKGEERRAKKEEKSAPQIRAAILVGIPASPGIATGPIKVIHTAREINKVKKGEILVTEMTTPDFVPAMKKVVAIVTDRGGQTSHAAIVSRELGIPCVVGTEKATQILKNGQFVTVNGARGEVYKGGVGSGKWEVGIYPISHISPSLPIKTATKIYVNLAEPELAKEVAARNVDGVGLLRAEFMIAEIGIHPKKLIHDRKQKLFISKLEKGMRTFCEHFYPRPVVYRATDFKTNEYRNLPGGKSFEPEEPNPMMGFRGAYRYISDPEVFELELEAVKKVRLDFKNLWMMIPYVHLPWELAEVKKIIGSFGLFRGPSFKLWMMVEIPTNVILLEDFIKVGIDGVSIGSNDLTMLILGIDRDNSEVAKIFNEQDPAVLWALEKIIKTCHKYKITSSICGQAPSLYPELVEKLVKWGITSISVNPDAIDQVREIVYQAEKNV
ncbi:MAG: phosphoenolpyruvate synthase [Patescibacteria group bacterium]